jgi:hypothetical protein
LNRLGKSQAEKLMMSTFFNSLATLSYMGTIFSMFLASLCYHAAFLVEARRFSVSLSVFLIVGIICDRKSSKTARHQNISKNNPQIRRKKFNAGVRKEAA